jgi:hypothetical protein
MRLLAALAVLLLPAASQPTAETVARATNIPVEEWIAMATGRTLTYRINGEFWALEHYYPGTNRVTLQLYDGTCMQGTWDYHAPLYCFHWEGQGTSCFRHARLGDEILIIETQDGADTPMTQSMTAVTDVPLSCGPAVTS